MLDEIEKRESQSNKAEISSTKSPEEIDSSRPLAKHFMLSLIAAIKITQLYPETNPAIQKSIEKVKQKLADFTSKEDSLELIIRRKSLIYKSKDLFPHREDFNKFALKLYLLDAQQLIFNPPTTEQEIRDFIYLLGQKVENIRNDGGLLTLLEKRNIKNIEVTLAKNVKIIKEADDEEVDIEDIEEKEAGEMEELELRLRDFENNIDFFQNIFLSVSHLGPRHRNMLLGMLDSPLDFADVLLNISSQVIPIEGQTKLETQVDFIHNALNNLGEYILNLSPSEQEELFRKLSKVILSLKTELKEDLIQQSMLPQLSRGSLESKILSYFPALDLASALTSKLKLHAGASTTIYDALDALTVTEEKRNSILELLKQKLLLEKKLSKQFEELFGDVDSLTELHAEAKEPKRIEFPDIPFDFGPEEESYIVNKVQEFKKAPEEYELIYTMLDLLPFVENYDSFCAIMSKLEEKINILVSDLELAFLERVISLLKAEEESKKALSLEFGERINLTLETLSSPEMIGRLVDLAIETREGTKEFQQIYELTAKLGKVAVENLFNRLIEEESMIARKKILQLFIALGKECLPLVAKYINHDEWYVVRNIVYIMGHYGPDAVQHLKRVMSHDDYRVRKELISSLGLIQSEEAIDLIVTFLQDKDIRIQEAAVSQLRRFSDPKSIAYLINMLKQKENLKKNPSLILAIIKAFGQIGARESLPQLKIFCSKLWILKQFWSSSAWQIRRQTKIAVKLIERKARES